MALSRKQKRTLLECKRLCIEGNALFRQTGYSSRVANISSKVYSLFNSTIHEKVRSFYYERYLPGIVPTEKI